MSDTSTALVVAKRTEIAALQENNEKVEALIYNIQLGGGITEADIRRVVNPSGNGITFEIPRASGEPEHVRELVGIALAIVPRRQLWAGKNVGSGEAPVCSSTDLIHGVKRRLKNSETVDIPKSILDVGIPGGTDGVCAGCAFDNWGTAVKQDGSFGEGKACQESRVMYFLQKDEVLPLKLTIPAGSLQKFRATVKQIPVRLDQALVRVWLTSEQSDGGAKFPSYNIELVSKLDPEAVEVLKAYAIHFKKLIDNAVAERTDEGEGRRRAARAASKVPDNLKF